MRIPVPDDLINEYWDSAIVSDVFTHCEIQSKSQTDALVMCIKYLLRVNKELVQDSVKLNHVRSALELFNDTGYILKLPMLKEMVK